MKLKLFKNEVITEIIAKPGRKLKNCVIVTRVVKIQ